MNEPSASLHCNQAEPARWKQNHPGANQFLLLEFDFFAALALRSHGPGDAFSSSALNPEKRI
jgi:hypothetical protein